MQYSSHQFHLSAFIKHSSVCLCATEYFLVRALFLHLIHFSEVKDGYIEEVAVQPFLEFFPALHK